MNKNMILEYYWNLPTIVMNDDIVYFSYIELICIELYIMNKYDGVQWWWSE